ncbi:hypothetical protein [Alishewanella longhuensis]
MPSLFQQIQAGALWDFHGGVHPPVRKSQTNSKPVANMPLPDRLYVPVRQHIGVSGQLLVNAGERVLKGQALTFADKLNGGTGSCANIRHRHRHYRAHQPTPISLA